MTSRQNDDCGMKVSDGFTGLFRLLLDSICNFLQMPFPEKLGPP